MDHADLIIEGGSVVTLDERDRVAEAVAVVGGRIAAVGSRSDVRGLKGPGTSVIDIQGGAVLPGINDSHVHAISLGLDQPPLVIDLTYPRVRSIADVAEAVRARAATVPPGTWIRGHGWDAAYLAECQADLTRVPSRQDLDAATTEHPVVLDEVYGHSTWANTRALREAGIDASTQAPPGSAVSKDPVSGEPTGMLREGGARALVLDHMPPVTHDQHRQALKLVLDVFAGLGITSFTDPALDPGADTAAGGASHHGGIDVLAESARRGELTARANVLLLFTDADGTASADAIEHGVRTYSPPAGLDSSRLRIRGVKIFADGVPNNRTAWMNDPYAGSDTERGSLVVAGATAAERLRELQRMIAVTHAAGYQLGIHATGDATIDAVVAAYAGVMASGGNPDPRHYVIHGDLSAGATVTTMARQRIGINAQPAIQWTLSGMLPDVIGVQRTERQWPLRQLLDAGVRVALSSDGPVTFPDWRRGVAAAVLRESKATGTVVGPSHRIGVLEAIRGYTMAGAWQDHAEDWKGSIEVGKVADLCVLGASPLAVDPHELPDVPIRWTLVSGDVIYENHD